MKRIVLSVFSLIFLFGGAFSVSAQNIEIDFFYSSTCHICAQEEEFLSDLQDRYPELKINYYEVMGSTENQELLMEFYNENDISESLWGRVPLTVTPNKYLFGFSDQIGGEIEDCLLECISGEGTEQRDTIDVPFFGTVDISNMSLPVLTIVIAAMDGFNPCAMWVLVFLLTLLMNTHSRKRMFLVGGTFVFVSGLIYFLILAAWLNLFMAISYVNITRIAIGVLAVGVGFWQIKNFIQYKPGVCKVTDGNGIQERLKEKMKSKAEKIALSPFTFVMLGGTILLAVGVNLVEFFCSAGLPAIYTKVLSISDLSGFAYYLYLLLYTFIFMLDDMIILFVAVITLSRFGFTEEYNYWSTLIGGLLILILGILLIFKPELLMFV
ncbi:MAG: hypothetical protein WC302_02500 [Candidatus Paceibacterota bacterium]|jgi:hypothetical protein